MMRRFSLFGSASVALLFGGIGFIAPGADSIPGAGGQEPPPSVRALQAAMGELSEDSLYRKRMAGFNAEERRAETRKLAHRGLSRLEDSAVAELAVFLHEALAALPTERCGTLSAGSVGLLGIAGELTSLDSARAFRGYRIIADAVRSELHGSPDRRKVPDDERVSHAMRALARTIPASDSTRFASLLDPADPSLISPSERCWFRRTLLSATLELDPRHRTVLLGLMSFGDPKKRKGLPALIRR